MKHIKSVEILSIFGVPSPPHKREAPAETQSPPIENFLATVLTTPPCLAHLYQMTLRFTGVLF